MIHEIDMPPNQQWHCNLVLTVLVVCQCCSTYFIVIMTFERFYSIIRPHKAASFNTVKRAKIIIICIVIFSSFLNIPDLFYTRHWESVFCFGKISIHYFQERVLLAESCCYIYRAIFLSFNYEQLYHTHITT